MENISSLAEGRLHSLMSELAAAGIVPRIAVESKFFLQDAKGARIVPDDAMIGRLNEALRRRGFHARIKRQIAADGRRSMLEANFDPWRDLKPESPREREEVVLMAPRECERFAREAQEIVAEAAPEATLNRKPRPFAEDRLMTVMGLTDANSMHLNISLFNDRGENLLAQSERLRKNAAQWLKAAQAEGLLAYMPAEESYERLRLNFNGPGTHARASLTKPGGKAWAGSMALAVASCITCSVAGVPGALIMPVALAQTGLICFPLMKSRGGSFSVRKQTGTLKNTLASMPGGSVIKTAATPDEVRIEDRLPGADSNALLCSALIVGALACSLRGKDHAIESLDNDQLARKPEKRPLVKTAGEGLYLPVEKHLPPKVSTRFPRNKEAAQRRFAQSELMRDILGDDLCMQVKAQHAADGLSR